MSWPFARPWVAVLLHVARIGRWVSGGWPTRLWVVGLAMSACVLAACGSAVAVSAPDGRFFVYVADKGRNEISQYGVSPTGALKPLTPATVASGNFPAWIAITPNGKNAYVADIGSISAPAEEISQYSINTRTGKLTAKSPATMHTPGVPAVIAVAPNGASLYAADSGKNVVAQYTINRQTGKLTPKSPATVATGANPQAIAVTPNGNSLYVAGYGTKTIAQYSIDPTTGKLTPKSPGAVPDHGNAETITIAPNGKSAYIPIPNVPSGGAVAQFNINPRTGKLSPKSPATVATAGGPHDVAVTHNGKYAYVVTVANNTVSQYSINQHTGALSPQPVATAHALRPEDIVIAPNGKNAYINSEKDGIVSQYTIDPTTGKITPMSPATAKSASGSIALAVTPELSAK